MLFFVKLNSIFSQEKIPIHCKINFYKEHSLKPANKLNIVFELLVRFAEFDDKTKIENLKVLEGSVTTKDIVNYMSLLGWQLLDSTNSKDLGYTFYFQKVLDKSAIDFTPRVQLKPVFETLFY